MSLVLDCSVTLAWFFEDEQTSEVKAVLERVATSGAIVPLLWRLEVANGLQTAVRRRRITPYYLASTLADLSALSITDDAETNMFAWSTTLALADRFQLTTYDAAYLELAHRQRLPLASLDRPLRSAASTLGVPLAGLAT